MSDITDRENTLFVETAKKIRLYKLMQAGAYKKLIRKAADQNIKKILTEISDNELNDAETWQEQITQLSIGYKSSGRIPFLSQRISLMMIVLGTRGFFEWAVIAEDESVEDLAIQAVNINDEVYSEKWTRIAADERLHIERIKKEILGMEGWEMSGGGGVRDVIFGANDGLVSILALVAGVYGAITESHPILIAGIAGAVAGAVSMGAGAYLSSKSEKEVTEKEDERKGIRKKRTPEEEKAEIVNFYQSKGFKKQEALAIANRVISQIETSKSYTLGEELGLTLEESWPPVKAAIYTGLSFAVVSLIPILPFAFLEVNPAVITATVASIACLFLVGASKVLFSRQSWVRSGLEMMAIGVLASVATYLIGLAIPV